MKQLMDTIGRKIVLFVRLVCAPVYERFASSFGPAIPTLAISHFFFFLRPPQLSDSRRGIEA
jgi:hypothetical protein